MKDDPIANQENAIKRAKQLVEKHKEITNPHEKNPITTIFELVEALNAHIKQ